MKKRLYLFFIAVVMLISCIQIELSAALSHCLNSDVCEQWHSGKRVSRGVAENSVNHRFHWKRHWYQLQENGTIRYYWGPTKLYLYSPRTKWTHAWSITNGTPENLLIHTNGITFTITPRETCTIPRNGHKRLQVYSCMTGERILLRTRAPEFTVHYIATQDNLIIMPKQSPLKSPCALEK